MQLHGVEIKKTSTDVGNDVFCLFGGGGELCFFVFVFYSPTVKSKVLFSLSIGDTTLFLTSFILLLTFLTTAIISYYRFQNKLASVSLHLLKYGLPCTCGHSVRNLMLVQMWL